jgi:hypothetical protein
MLFFNFVVTFESYADNGYFDGEIKGPIYIYASLSSGIVWVTPGDPVPCEIECHFFRLGSESDEQKLAL